MSNITVRQLIEHLAQYDPDFEVKTRDPRHQLILHDIQAHDVELEEFVDMREYSARTSFVVVVG